MARHHEGQPVTPESSPYSGPYGPNPVPLPSPAPGLPPLAGGGPQTARMVRPKRYVKPDKRKGKKTR